MVEGIPFDEIRERREREDAENAAEADAKKKGKIGSASTKKKGALALAKKKFAKKNEVEFTIKMKDEEGKIVEFIDENPPAVVAKKKKKTVKAKAGAENKVNVPEIEAEDTLAMIKNALKSGPGQMASEFGTLDDMEKPKKKKKKPTSASNKKKVK